MITSVFTLLLFYYHLNYLKVNIYIYIYLKRIFFKIICMLLSKHKIQVLLYCWIPSPPSPLSLSLPSSHFLNNLFCSLFFCAHPSVKKLWAFPNMQKCEWPRTVKKVWIEFKFCGPLRCKYQYHFHFSFSPFCFSENKWYKCDTSIVESVIYFIYSLKT